LRLGFHYHIPAEQREDGIYLPGYLSRFLDSLAAHCEELVCFLHQPRPSQREILDTRLEQPNIRLVSIGEHCAAWKRSFFPARFVEPLIVESQQLDMLLARGPSPLLPAFCATAQRLGLATALLIVGSYVDGVEDLPQPRWRKELIRFYGYLNQWQQDRVAARSLTFVNSRHLYDRYAGRIPNLLETRTTTLSRNDFYYREDTCEKLPARLLYTGRFDRGKGLLELVEALAIRVDAGDDLVLDLVGWPEPGDNVVDETLALAHRLGVGGRVVNHGLKAVGPELFAYYRQADIYVIASKRSEGFPRTIWEAMAHSVPVLTTAVGAIPQILGSTAMVVEPGNAQALSAGIASLLGNPGLRQAMIRQGLELARENTLERRSEEMIADLVSWQKKGGG